MSKLWKNNEVSRHVIMKKRSNMTPVTFDTFRDTHPPARTNANFPARSRSGLDHEKEVKYDTVTLSIEDTCLTFLIRGVSFFTCIAQDTVLF